MVWLLQAARLLPPCYVIAFACLRLCPAFLLLPCCRQVADPEMLTMMELFSNPENQPLLKAKMEELKQVGGRLRLRPGRQACRACRLVSRHFTETRPSWGDSWESALLRPLVDFCIAPPPATPRGDPATPRITYRPIVPTHAR